MQKILGVKSALKRFLLAYLQINGLAIQSPKSIRNSLSTLPTKVYDTYENAVTRIKDQSDQDAELAVKLISFVFYAKRPLATDELLHALAVEEGDTELDKTALSEIEILLSISAGLVTLNKKSKTIELVHFTLQEYLEKFHSRLLPGAEAEMAKVCLNYLSFDIFDDGPCQGHSLTSDRLEEYRFLKYASMNWGYHVRAEQKPELMQKVLSYLSNSPKLLCSLQVLAYYSFNNHSLKRFRRVPSPKHFSLLHAIAYWSLDCAFNLLPEQINDIDERDSYGMTPLHWAAENGYEETVRMLLQKGANTEVKNKEDETPLCCAVNQTRVAATGILLEYGADIEAKCRWGTVLHYAVDEESKDRDEVVLMLLKRGANGHARGLYGTPLHHAVQRGNVGQARLLLEHGADTFARSTDESTDDSTVLHAAVHFAHLFSTELFPEKGIYINM